LVTLAAALRAIAGLDSDKLESACELLIAGAHVSARVTAPEPELMFSELSEDDVLQVALEAQRAARRGRRKSR
jgi:hypothetical protein